MIHTNIPRELPAYTQCVLRDPQAATGWLCFHSPVRTVYAVSSAHVVPGLEEVEQWTNCGYWAVGFLGYETAPAFDPAMAVSEGGTFTRLPLMWFGIFEESEETALCEQPANDYELSNWEMNVGKTTYDTNIRQIRDYIAAGDIYQVNYTVRNRATFSGNPYDLFEDLARAQRSGYPAFIHTPDFTVCSASPELFFALEEDRLFSKPMKGTVKRGKMLHDDQEAAEWLGNSEKNKAENLMIVDMVRHDLGRIARPGTVDVPKLFELEKYPTVWQMTSTVRADTDASLPDIFTALFPGASITGAPKIRAMQIISELETSPRGLYTGSVGFITPERRAQFNIAIRSVVVDNKNGNAEYGVGGGIVWDSEASSEYGECRAKSRVLVHRQPEFALLETMLWEADKGIFLLALHLKRLAQSAAYFDFSVDIEAVKNALLEETNGLGGERYKVRMLVDRNGEPRIQTSELPSDPSNSPVRLGVARESIDLNTCFLYHKTTNRSVYDYAKKGRDDVDDVLLWNPKQEVSEATIANVVVEQNGEFWTPPVECGLLAGTFREWLLQQGKIREKPIKLAELDAFDNIYLINGVRGWVPVATIV